MGPSLRVINGALSSIRSISMVITPGYPLINPFIRAITPFITGRGPPRRAIFKMQVFLSPLFDDYFENSSVQTTPTLYQKNSNIISNLSLATHILLHQLFKLQPTAMQYAWRTLAPQPTAPTFCHVTLAQWVPPIHLAACLPRQLLADDLTNGCDSFPSV